MRRRAQGRVVDSSGWCVKAMSRWVALCTGRGCGKQVKDERGSMINGCGWGVGKKYGETNDLENGRGKRWGGSTSYYC